MRGIFPGVDIDELVGASALNIDPAYARDMKSHFPDVGIDDVVALRAMGVDSDFVTDMQKAGVKMRSADDAIELRATGGWSAAATSGGKGAKGPKSATISFGPGGGVIEARSADGRVARLELPEPPEPSAPPAPPGT